MTPAPAPRLNVYRCQVCGGATVTVDLDEGTTPFMLGCRAESLAGGRRASGKCSGMAQSSMYRVAPLWLAHVSHAWVRPADPDNINPRDYDHAGDWDVGGPNGMREWVKSGCLLLRKLSPKERHEIRQQGRAAMDMAMRDMRTEDAETVRKARAFSEQRDPDDLRGELAVLRLRPGPRNPIGEKARAQFREIGELKRQSEPWRGRGRSGGRR